MILADTSIWIDHFRESDAELRRIIEEDALLCHPFVIGELALGSLPARFGDRLDGKPYLVPDSDGVAAWKQRLAQLPAGLNIGISWRGGADPVVRRRRSIDSRGMRLLEDTVSGRSEVQRQSW